MPDIIFPPLKYMYELLTLFLYFKHTEVLNIALAKFH